MTNKKTHKYDIDSLCKIFKEHAEEYDSQFSGYEDDFNLARALLAICESLKKIEKD